MIVFRKDLALLLTCIPQTQEQEQDLLTSNVKYRVLLKLVNLATNSQKLTNCAFEAIAGDLVVVARFTLIKFDKGQNLGVEVE
jgi:hypothetical protein